MPYNAVCIGTGGRKSKRADAMGAFLGIKVGPFDKFPTLKDVAGREAAGKYAICLLSV